MKIKRLAVLLIIAMLTWSHSYAADNKATIFKGKLAFSSNRFILDERYKSAGVCLLKNGEVTFLAKAALPSWSPNGSLLMVAHTDNSIHIIRDNGELVEKISTSTTPYYPQWHPTENKLFYGGEETEAGRSKGDRKKIFMYDRDKKETSLIFYEKDKEYIMLGLHISPDGKHIAFEVFNYPEDENRYVSPRVQKREGVHVMDIDGNNLELVYTHGLLRGWFPDGKHLCYGANIGEDENLLTPVGRTAGYLFKYNIEKKTKEIVGKDAFSSFSKLSRDGKYLYYSNGAGIWVGPIEDVTKSELVVRTALINPKNPKDTDTSQEFESDWFQGE